MVRNLSIYILFFIVLTLHSQTLKVITFNLEGMKPGTQPELRIGHIANALIEYNADIIGFQEINENLNGSDNQLVAIRDSLEHHFATAYYIYQQSTHLSWDNQFREYIGIISKYPFEKEGYKSLPQGTFPRKVVWTYVVTPWGKVRFFNTHLSFNSQTTRTKQVQTIIDFIDAIETYNPGIGTILTGDFNDTPNTTPIKMLTSTDSDTFYVSSFAGINPGSPGYTVPATSPTSKIDYIFYKNSGSVAVDSSVVIMKSGACSGGGCSDHLGILTFFKFDLTGIDDNNDHQLPKSIEPGINYPNPFNPSTQITFTVNFTSQVSLKIYDIRGKLVRTLQDGQMGPGNYHLTWNGKDRMDQHVASGIYVYRLANDQTVFSGKMLLLR